VISGIGQTRLIASHCLHVALGLVAALFPLVVPAGCVQPYDDFRSGADLASEVSKDLTASDSKSKDAVADLGVDGHSDTGAGDTGGQADGGDALVPADLADATWNQPEGTAAITFFVDDSANKTFEDGQIVWLGSFQWDQGDNTIAYAASWLLDEGPYPASGIMALGNNEKRHTTTPRRETC